MCAPTVVGSSSSEFAGSACRLTSSGTLDSPEWRKGPGGPKTLCNACGLRWAKKEKKKNAGGGGGMQDGQTPMIDG